MADADNIFLDNTRKVKIQMPMAQGWCLKRKNTNCHSFASSVHYLYE